MHLLVLSLFLSRAALAADLDGDGYDASVDCDDTRADVHPGQQEVCEDSVQIDSDCNGDVNSAEGFSTLINPKLSLYIDEDGDNYGDPDVGAVEACELVDGYASNGADCDDTDATAYPGAPEVCDLKDQDCDGQIDEPELDAGSGCVDMYRDLDGDGYGDSDVEACLCLYDDSASAVHPADGHDYVVFGGDCHDYDSDVRPRSCADGHDNDEDGLSDEQDPDCQAGLDEVGAEAEAAVERLDGHDSDCDGFVPLVELDCDDDGSLPLLPLEGQPIDAGRHPDYAAESSYREAWVAIGLHSADDAGLAECGKTIVLPGCMGEELVLSCDSGGTGLWMLDLSDSSDGFGGRFDGGARSYAAVSGGRESEVAGDCDDHCPARHPGATEACDGVDGDCSDADPGEDHDGVPDAVDPEVTTEGTVSLAESDADGDGHLDCDAFSEGDEQAGWSFAACEPIIDADLLADFDDSNADVQDTPADTDDGSGSKGCVTAPAAAGWLGLSVVAVALRRRRRRA